MPLTKSDIIAALAVLAWVITAWAYVDLRMKHYSASNKIAVLTEMVQQMRDIRDIQASVTADRR